MSSFATPVRDLDAVYWGSGHQNRDLKYSAGDFQERNFAQLGHATVADGDPRHDGLLFGFAAMMPGRYARVGH